MVVPNGFKPVAEPAKEHGSDFVTAEHTFQRPPAIQEFERVMGAKQIKKFPFRASAGNVTVTGFERVARQGRLPAWISSPTDGIASRRRSSSTRSGFTGSH